MSSLTSGIGGGWFGNKKSTNTEVGSVNEDQLLVLAAWVYAQSRPASVAAK